MSNHETTITRALTDAERASIEAAATAAARGLINQREVREGSGVWQLKPKQENRS